MAITIKKNKDVFTVHGIMNAATSKSLQAHFEYILNSTNELTINIEGLKEIDANGVMTLKALYYHAVSNNKTFTVTGYGCKDFYNELSHSSAA